MQLKAAQWSALNRGKTLFQCPQQQSVQQLASKDVRTRLACCVQRRPRGHAALQSGRRRSCGSSWGWPARFRRTRARLVNPQLQSFCTCTQAIGMQRGTFALQVA